MAVAAAAAAPAAIAVVVVAGTAALAVVEAVPMAAARIPLQNRSLTREASSLP